MNITDDKILPYLPYGLEIINSIGKRIELTISDYKYHKEKGFKPILRPLKDTQTLEVDFNGDIGVFSDNYFGFTSFQYYYNEYLKYGRAYWHNRAPYVVVKRLLEYGFDVFGQIEDEIAIDINTVSLAEA